MEQQNGMRTYIQRTPHRRRAARWLAGGMLAVWLTAGCGSWPFRQAMAGEKPATGETAFTAGAHSHFMDFMHETYDPSPDRLASPQEPSAAFLRCVEPINRTVEEDGIRVTALEAISDGRYLAVYMEIENLVPWDWAMADVKMSARANGKAASSMFMSDEAMWIPYTLHPYDETRTIAHPWFGIYALPEGADGHVTMTAEVGIFRMNGPLVMLAPNLYERMEDAGDPWMNMFRERMKAHGITVAGEDEMDAAAWVQAGYIPIAGSKFALDEGHQLLPDAAEARGDITRTGTVNLAFTLRGDAGASMARALAPGGEYALGNDTMWVDRVFVSPAMVRLEMRSTFPGDDTDLSPDTLLADGAGNLLEWESVIRHRSSWSLSGRADGGLEPLFAFDIWAAPGAYLSARQLIVAMMTPGQRYGGLETVADLEREGIAYAVIPLDGAGWAPAGFPLPEEIPEVFETLAPAERGVGRYTPIPLETLAP